MPIWSTLVGMKGASANERTPASAQLDTVPGNDVLDRMGLLERVRIHARMSEQWMIHCGQAARMTRSGGRSSRKRLGRRARTGLDVSHMDPPVECAERPMRQAPAGGCPIRRVGVGVSAVDDVTTGSLVAFRTRSPGSAPQWPHSQRT